MTKLNFSNHVCHCGAVVKARCFLHVQINRVRLSATLLSVSLYRFLIPFGLYFKHYFSFWPFFIILTADPAGHAPGSIYILSLSPEFYFEKGIQKALDLHTGQAYDQIKTMSCQDMSLRWNSWIFFNVSWHHDKHTHSTPPQTVLIYTHQWPTGES